MDPLGVAHVQNARHSQLFPQLSSLGAVNDAGRLCRWGRTPGCTPKTLSAHLRLHVTTLTHRFFLDSGHNLKPLFIRFNSLRSGSQSAKNVSE